MDRPFPAYSGDDPYIFVSYAHDDDEIVYPEILWLKDQGFNIWYDEGISPGTEWRTELSDSIKASSLFLYFITPRSVASNHCRREVNLATDLQKQILVVQMEETELPSGLDLTLSAMQAILRYEISDHAYRSKLITGVSAHLQRGVAQAYPAPTTTEKRDVRSVLLSIGIVGFAILAATTLLQMFFSKEVSVPEEVTRFVIAVPGGYVPNYGLPNLDLS